MEILSAHASGLRDSSLGSIGCAGGVPADPDIGKQAGESRRGIGLGADDGGSAASRAVTESFVLPASCTLCGDVDDSEVVDVVDAVAEARALAMLAPPMVAPEKCNVVGATDPADGDMDGLPDDCDSSDLAILRDHLAELTPGIGSVCEPAVGLAP